MKRSANSRRKRPKTNTVRLIHKTHRGPSRLQVVVTDPARRYGPNRPVCVKCQVKHTHKAIHLEIEPDGTCLVSTGVLNELRAVDGRIGGRLFGPVGVFDIGNPVHDAPPLVLTVGANGTLQHIKRLEQIQRIHI